MRFHSVNPLTRGRIGHALSNDRRMFACVGVSFTDAATRDNWSFRIYSAFNRHSIPEREVWTYAKARVIRSGKPAGHLNMVVVPEDEVPEPVRVFAKAELVRLRLLGKIRA